MATSSKAMAMVVDLRGLVERQPELMRELAELLDRSLIEVRELLYGEIEPGCDDQLIIGTLLQHHRRASKQGLAAMAP